MTLQDSSATIELPRGAANTRGVAERWRFNMDSLLQINPSCQDENEEWREIPGFPGYEASSLGRIRSIPWKGIQHQCPNGRYLSVQVKIEGKRKALWVHRGVLLAFKGQPLPNQECRHINGNPKDNRIDNLAWGTPFENTRDKYLHGRILYGETNLSAKLTASQVSQIRESTLSSRELGAAFGVSDRHVRDIRKGKYWRQHDGR